MHPAGSAGAIAVIPIVPFLRAPWIYPSQGESTVLPTLTQNTCKDLWGFEQHPKVASRVREHSIPDIEELTAKYDHASSKKGAAVWPCFPVCLGLIVLLGSGPRLCIQQKN